MLARRMARRVAGRRARTGCVDERKDGAVAVQRLLQQVRPGGHHGGRPGCARCKRQRRAPVREGPHLRPRPRLGPDGILRRARDAAPAPQGRRRRSSPSTGTPAFRRSASRCRPSLRRTAPSRSAIIQDPRPSGKYYSKRFMNALGSAERVRALVVVQPVEGERLPADHRRVELLHRLRQREDGHVHRPQLRRRHPPLVRAEPGRRRRSRHAHRHRGPAPQQLRHLRRATGCPSTPGTDLAFSLGICNVLIEEDLYDHELRGAEHRGLRRVRGPGQGTTRPSGPRRSCDVPAEPHPGAGPAPWPRPPRPPPSRRAGAPSFGCSYQNSFETARAVTAVNALLGAWGAEGRRAAHVARRRPASID